MIIFRQGRKSQDGLIQNLEKWSVKEMDEETKRYPRYYTNVTMATLLLLAHNGKLKSNFRALSKKIVELGKNKEIEIGRFYIRRDAIGYDCETLAGFLGSFVIAGDASERSEFEKIELRESGVRRCQNIITNAFTKGDSAKIVAIMNALGIVSIEDFANLVFK